MQNKEYEIDFSLYDFVPIGICVIDEDYKILCWNRCLCGWTGMEHDSTIGKNLIDIYPHLKDPVFKLRIDLMFHGHPPTFFSSLLHKYFFPVKISEKEYQIQSATLTSIPANNGKDFLTLIAIENNTNLVERVNNYKQMKNKAFIELQKRVEAEERIKEYAAKLEIINSTKDKFFSIIAHDLRSPLGAFIGLTKTMAENIWEFSITELQDLCKKMNQTSNNLFSLLENLLQWSRMQRGIMVFNPEPCQIDLIIKNILNISNEYARQKNIAIDNKITTEIHATADVQMLNAILRNLITNAIKFTHRGGNIQIGTLTPDNPDANEVCLYVKDTGIGMNEKTLTQIFQLDKIVSNPGTENESSTGLGLILCKDFIEKHQGKIWVDSIEGKGSTFFFSIPRVPKKVTEISSTSEPTESNTITIKRKLKILLAENDEVSVRLINSFISHLSEKLIVAKNGLDAVDLFNKNPDFDLILMDIKMPEMDGYEATRKIRENNKEVIIIAETAYGLKGDRKKAIEAGCNDYIAKPIKKEDFLALINKYF